MALICPPDFSTRYRRFEESDIADGDRALTRDNDTQLEWLDLTETVGVCDVRVEENWELIPGFVETDDGLVSIEVDYFTRAVLVEHNETVLSALELAEGIGESGFGVGQPQREGRVGKQIVVPPDVI